MENDWSASRQEDDVVASWQHFNHACGLMPVDRISMVHKALVEELLMLRPRLGIVGWLLLLEICLVIAVIGLGSRDPVLEVVFVVCLEVLVDV